MGKSFFEVFPALKLDAHTGDIMGQTEVVKVSTTRKQDFIRIYIASNKLIDKADIIKTESSIKKQLFADSLFHRRPSCMHSHYRHVSASFRKADRICCVSDTHACDRRGTWRNRRRRNIG